MQQDLTQEVLTRLDAVAASLQVGVEQLVGAYGTMVVADGVTLTIWAVLLAALSSALLYTARKNYKIGATIVGNKESMDYHERFYGTRRRQVTFWDLPSSIVMAVTGIFGILFLFIATNVATYAVKYLMAPEAYAIRELLETAL